MPPRVPHIFENGIEKKRCSKCRRYLPLSDYIYKKDRVDRLNNECNECRLIRNKRRYRPEWNIGDDNNDEEKVQENTEEENNEEEEQETDM